MYHASCIILYNSWQGGSIFLTKSCIHNSWHHLPASQNHHTLLHQHFRPKLFTQLNIFCRFSSTSPQVNRRCWGLRCKSRTHKTLTGDQPPPRPKPKTWLLFFPRFYFLHFAELCPKKWQLGLPRITITIIRITTTAPAGKTLTARRSHVWSLLIMASNNSNNNNNNWRN